MGFPLSFGLLLTMFFCMIAFYAARIHWNKLRSFLLSSQDVTSDIETDILEYSHRNPVPPCQMPEQSENPSVSVLMPGDQAPKFIAMACPCRPPLYAKDQN
ncbi:hypothetical protein I3760_08G059500 [Carya illinoinensis]|nr:hypothetical protein I3760_08G059500 [Carya illinoinensis]